MDLGAASTWLAPAVALTIGTVTALLTGMTLIVGKENKVSEFRQEWINGQREDIASALAAAQAYLDAGDDKRPEHLLAFDGAQARIELRENPLVEEWSAVRERFGQLRDEMLGGRLDRAKMLAHRTDILLHARPTLKTNWTIVKEGETGYAVFKRSYAIFVCILVVLAAIWMVVVAKRS